MKQGSVELGILVGLLIGSVALWINSGERAQELANAQGREVSQWEAIQESPGKSMLTVVGPGAAGAGIGWLLDEVSGGSSGNSSESTSVTIEGEGNSVVISRDQDNDSSASTRTDTRADGSYNQ